MGNWSLGVCIWVTFLSACDGNGASAMNPDGSSSADATSASQATTGGLTQGAGSESTSAATTIATNTHDAMQTSGQATELAPSTASANTTTSNVPGESGTFASTTTSEAVAPSDTTLGESSEAEVASSSGADSQADAAVPEPAFGHCPLGPYAASPIPPSVQFATLCSDLRFTEGPVWVEIESSLFFSDFDNEAVQTNFAGDIVRYSADEGCEVWLPDAGSNGLALGTDGELVACRHTTQTVTAYEIETRVGTNVVDDFGGSNFSSPNDLAVRSDGNLYFSDPAWNVGQRSQELPQSLYRVDPQGTVSVVEVLTDLRPNGVALSPDETRLYVALLNEIRSYDLDSAGMASNAQSFAGVGSDGLAIDCAGNVYVTSGGIQVYSPLGELIDSLGAVGDVTNLAFGGASGQTLFVTGGTRLQSVELLIPGLPY